MKEVLLSAEDDLCLYAVPADVADNLNDVCHDFADFYVWHSAQNAKFIFEEEQKKSIGSLLR